MRGPGLDLTTLITPFDYPLDAGIRVIVDYRVEIDYLLTRIDVKIADRQYGAAFYSSVPIEPKAGERFKHNDDMITPKKTVDNCINVKANKAEILRALKELVSDIENDKED